MDNNTSSNSGKTQRQQVNEIRNKKIIKLVLFISVCLAGLVAILINTMDFSKAFHSGSPSGSVVSTPTKTVAAEPRKNATTAPKRTPTPTPKNTPTPNTPTPTPKQTRASTSVQSSILAGVSSHPDEYSYAFNGPYRRRQIVTIVFRNTTYGAPKNAWDASERKDRSVIAWATRSKTTYNYKYDSDVPSDGVYDLIIASDGKVCAPVNCNYLFSNFAALKSVRFNNCFDTSNVTNMSAMFGWDLNLKDADLSGIDTSQVTDMSFMFSCNFSLKELDLTRFDTRKVTDMQSMFWGNDQLKTIRTSSNFVIGSSTNTEEMLEDCPVFKIGSYVNATPTPTARPTVKITAKPTVKPTAKPTTRPTAKPTVVAYEYSSSVIEYDRRRGDNDDQVKRIQQRLIDLGYLDDKADGQFGPKTKAAVEAFQRNNGIHGQSSAYGVATQMTQAVLFSDNARRVNQAPRLSAWSISSEPYSTYKGERIYREGGDTYLEFDIWNKNKTQPIVALVIRYWLLDSKEYVIEFTGGYTTYQSWKNSSYSLVDANDRKTITWKLTDDIPLNRAVELRWVVTEIVYANGEVYMDYDASESKDYQISAYTTAF